MRGTTPGATESRFFLSRKLGNRWQVLRNKDFRFTKFFLRDKLGLHTGSCYDSVVRFSAVHFQPNGGRGMARLTVGQRASRVLVFLFAFRNPRIAGPMSRFGFKQAQLDEGWEKLRKASRTRLGI